MKPILVTNPDNPKDPFYVCRKQLAELDSEIKRVHPTAILSEGCKYARWAEIDYNIFPNYFNFTNGYEPDHFFLGKISGKDKLILMWMPFFD